MNFSHGGASPAHLFGAIEVATNPHSSQADRLQAHQTLKFFEENIVDALPLIFQLIEPSCEAMVRQYGLHLLEQFIRTRWMAEDENDMQRMEIRNRILDTARSKLLAADQEFPIIRECYAKCLNEISKKEFPQKWPTFFDDCATLAASGLNQQLIIVSLWTRLFEDVVFLQNVEPVRRRRDLYNVLVDKIEIFLDASLCILKEIGPNTDAKLKLKLKLENLEFLAILMELLPVSTMQLKCDDLFEFLYKQLVDDSCAVVQASVQCLCNVRVAKLHNFLVNALGYFLLQHGKLDYQPIIRKIVTLQHLYQLDNAIKKLLTGTVSQPEYHCLKLFGDYLLALCTNLNSVWESKLTDDQDFVGAMKSVLDILCIFLRHPSVVLRSRAAASCNILTKNELFSKCKLFGQFAITIIEMVPVMIQMIGFPSKSESPYSEYSRMEFDDDIEFIVEFSKFRESSLSIFKRLLNFDVRPAYNLMTRFLCEKLPAQFNELSHFEWDAWIRFTTVTVFMMCEKSIFDTDEEYRQNARTLITIVLDLLKSHSSISNADLLLSTLSALFPLLRHHTDLVPEIVVQIIRLTLWPDPETSELSRKLRHHAMHEFVHLTIEQTAVLAPFTTQIMQAMEIRASELTLRQKSSLSEGFVVLSNFFKNFDQQVRMIDYLVGSSVAYLSSDEFIRISSDSSNFANFIGLCNYTSEVLTAEDIFFLRRKEILSHVMTLVGVLNRCTLPTDLQIIKQGGYESEKSANLRHPAFDIIRPIIHRLFCLARCANGLYTKNCVSTFHPAFSGYKVIGLMDFEKNFNMLSAMALQQQEKDDELKTFDHMQLFIADLIEKMQILIGLVVYKFDWQFYEMPEACDYLKHGILDYVEDSLDQRLRFWIRRCFVPIVSNLNNHYRHKLLPCLSVLVNHIHKRLCNRWSTIKDRVCNDQDQIDSDLTQQEIFLDDLTRLFTREYLIFLKLTICLNTHTSGIKKSSQNVEKFADRCTEPNDDEEGFDESLENVEMKSDKVDSKHDLGASDRKISLFGMDLLDPKNKCVESITLTVFSCFTWLDTLSVVKACELGPVIVMQLMLTNLLSEQVVENLFSCVLSSLQLHGQHDITCGSLLSFLCFLHEFLAPKFPCVRRMLAELPNSSFEKVDAYERTLKPVDDRGKMTSKFRRESFKRIISGIIGQNIGQRFKEKVSYKLRMPICFKAKEEQTSCVKLEENLDSGLCALFGSV